MQYEFKLLNNRNTTCEAASPPHVDSIRVLPHMLACSGETTKLAKLCPREPPTPCAWAQTVH
eukprot:7033367-Lingulodinium_polyedra.AAC.1